MNGELHSSVVEILEGFFLMGSDSGHDNEKPRHRVWVDRFALAKYPVSNREYAVFIEETRALPPPFWSEPMFAGPDRPVVGVTWFDAISYCRWLSQRTGQTFELPTEAQWERAARGRLQGALYPWGDDPPQERRYLGYDEQTGGPQRLGANEPNDFGLYDMSEGVHEWCSDYYDRDYYSRSPERNPQGPPAGTRRVSRGGSWRHRVKFARCAARSSLPPDFKYSDYGFRVMLRWPG